MTTTQTQTGRVLAALRNAGDRGITQVDFLLPGVVDGGPPITRLGARILELRGEGHNIIVTSRRDKCAVYVITQPGKLVGLFDPSVGRRPPRGPYDDDDLAAA